MNNAVDVRRRANNGPQRAVLLLALLCTMLYGCSDLGPLDHPGDQAIAAPDVPHQQMATGQSQAITDIAQAVAGALGDRGHRMRLLADLRDSPFPQHRIHFTEYLRGDRGSIIASRIAAQLNLSPAQLRQQLDNIPPLEMIVPRAYDRAFWDGRDDIIVVGLDDVHASFASRLRGVDVHGGEHVVEMWRWVPDRPVLMVYPVEHDFGAAPEQQRKAAPNQARSTISTRQEEVHPSFFRGSNPAGRDAADMDVNAALDDCGGGDGTEVIIPCDPGSGGGTNWGGYFLPEWVTWNACISVPGDYDGDGFRDACEFELAKQFAPKLATNPFDIVTREPAWTAGPIPSSGRVVIFYAISYHIDLGCQTSNCGPWQGATWHYGDSEWIVVLVEPVSPNSHRWRVVRATLSAHWGTGWPWDQSRVVDYPDLSWADNYRGRPLIWASYGKHANYKSKSSCSDKLNDTCSGNAPESLPLRIEPNRQLGLSWGNTLMNCVHASGWYGPQPGQECYWTADRFKGWQAATPDAGGYKYSLSYFGF